MKYTGDRREEWNAYKRIGENEEGETWMQGKARVAARVIEKGELSSYIVEL